MNEDLEKALYKELKKKSSVGIAGRRGILGGLKAGNDPDKAMYELYQYLKNKTVISEEELATKNKQLREKYEVPKVIHAKMSEIPDWYD